MIFAITFANAFVTIASWQQQKGKAKATENGQRRNFIFQHFKLNKKCDFLTFNYKVRVYLIKWEQKKKIVKKSLNRNFHLFFPMHGRRRLIKVISESNYNFDLKSIFSPPPPLPLQFSCLKWGGGKSKIMEK